ncbi:MAG TPA: tetratricopeptide repeat protein [Longimicrobiales bacterium]
MIDADRVLRPLREAEPAIDRLDSYESPAVLTEALRATWQAVERTLRTLLRSDATAPDDIRLTAMSPDQMSTDTVLTELRRRELISLALAGRVHELRQALQRADRGEVRASDADIAEDIVRTLTAEVHGIARRSVSPPKQAAAKAAPAAGDETDWDEADVVGYRGGLSLPRRPLVLAALAVVLLAIAIVAVLLLGGESEMERGVAAFREDRHAAAEQHFRATLADDEDNNTARLYLARILREDGRTEEAAQLLRAAATTAPDDAAVRRELGYLLLDQNLPERAAEQFRRAVELDAEEPLNWVGLVEALSRSGDPLAEEWLRRAPAEAQEMVRQRRSGSSLP